MTGTRSDVGQGVRKIKGKPLPAPAPKAKEKPNHDHISPLVGMGLREQMIQQGLITPEVTEEQQKDNDHSDCYQ